MNTEPTIAPAVDGLRTPEQAVAVPPRLSGAARKRQRLIDAADATAERRRARLAGVETVTPRVPRGRQGVAKGAK